MTDHVHDDCVQCLQREVRDLKRQLEARTPRVVGRSCLGYSVAAKDIDLVNPIVVLKIDHTARAVHIGSTK